MNKRLFFSISLVLVLCLASNASAGVVGFWNFNDSTANDSGGGNHHGTLEAPGPNTVTFVFDVERDSNVAAFPGDPCVMINCGGGKTNPGDPCTWADIIGNQITVAAWLKHDGLFFTSYEYVFAKEDMWRLSRYSSTRHMRSYFDDVGGTLECDVSAIADDGEWHHLAGVYDGATMKVYWDGYLSNTSDEDGDNLNSTKTHDVTIGGHPGNSVRVWKGWIDDVRLHDNAEPHWRIKLWARNFKAYIPVPVDGAINLEKTLAQLSWTGMPGTYDYRLYLGTDETLVTNGNASVDKGKIDVMSYGGVPMGDLAYDTAYYWRVDSNSALMPGIAEGDVWQFTTKPAWTENPYPFDGCKYVGTSQQLTWTGGADSIKHEVFFSTNEQWVIDACDSIQTTIPAPDPCVLSPAKRN